MRFEQAREVLEHAEQFHREVGAFYRRLNAGTNNARLSLLLDYLAGREARLADGLEHYLESTGDGVLDTWLQYTHDTDALPACPEAHLAGDATVDDVMALARQFHGCLRNLYSDITNSAEPPDVRAVFNSLLEAGEREWKKYARNVQMLVDL